MTDPNSERIGKKIRKHVRIETELEVSFVIESDDSKQVFHGRTRNISRGGACIRVLEGKEEIIARMSARMPTLKVSLTLEEEGKPIEFDGRTMWISSRIGWFMAPSEENMPVLMGMAFEGLTKKDSLLIDSFIEDLLLKDRASVEEIEKRIISRVSRRS